MQNTQQDLSQLTISQIAHVIEKDWTNVNFAARPYLQAMKQVSRIDQQYGQDSVHSIVLYFLSNAASWKGETARRVKAELNKRVKAQ